VPRGISLRLVGDANDYLGKGLSGGLLVVRPDPAAPFEAQANVIAGNVVAYGATSGEIFLRGRAGERFCVRNSGATAVVEGVGDHACEYMTGGRVVVLGSTGRNVAAGMSGGVGYFLDLDQSLVNSEMVSCEALDEMDAQFLESIVRRHLEHTESAVAGELLNNWTAALSRFSKVMPTDYKKVLAVSAQAEREGRDINTAIMEAVNG